MTHVLPSVYVEPPALQPYRYGLFGAAQPLTAEAAPDGDFEHWKIGGVVWESLAAFVASTYPAGLYAPCDVGGRHTKVPSDAVPAITAWPFAVLAAVECGSIGRDQAEFERRARAVLELARQHAVEQVLWTGGGGTLLSDVVGLNAAATATTSTVLTGTQAVPVAVSLVEAVRLCENWLGDHYSGRGLLHARRGLAPYADSKRQVHIDRDNTDALVTTLGTRWVFGAGYDGTGPGAQAVTATKSWIYATGQVAIAVDDVIVPADFAAALDRSLNRERVWAEQLHMVGIDGPWAAALVDFTL